MIRLPDHRALAGCVLLAFLWGQDRDLAAQESFPIYVGRRVCLKCHTDAPPPPSGMPRASECAFEPTPRHDRAYQALTAPEAESIAALSGLVEKPTGSRVCLDCHATGADEGRRWTAETFRLADGVQCEACHGAGSLHIDAVRGVARASNGARSALIRPGNREDCRHCHVERPSHDRVLKKGFRLTESDRAYKTPVNLAISPDGRLLLVVCERANSVIVIDVASRTPIAEIGVGRRPHDLAFSSDGRRAYVTNRMDATVTVIDTVAKSVVATLRVGHEPHGIVVEPGSGRLIVLNTSDNSISVVDLEVGREAQHLAASQGPWSVALDPTGRYAYVTNVRPRLGRFRDPPRSEVTVVDVAKGAVVARAVVPGANMLQGIAYVPRAGAVLFTLMRTKNLIPTSRLAQGWVITNGLGVLWPDGGVDQVLLDSPGEFFPDPMDIAVTPDGSRAVAVSGGADEIAVIGVGALLETIRHASDVERSGVLANHLGYSDRFVIERVRVGTNPRAVCYAPDGREVYVANALDDTVTVLETSSYRVVATIDLGGPEGITDLRWGERLFHGGSVTFGRQFSCRSCHPDGHVNGLSFDIEADDIGLHPVDNRTLRGIFDTPPFKWEGTNPTLQRQCGPRLAVFFTRLDPFSPKELDALVDYMCTIERPPNRFRDPGGLTVAQRRGKVIFKRTVRADGSRIPPEKRCAFCHSGAYLTNRTRNSVSTLMWFDARVDVDLRDLFDTDAFGELGNYFFVDVGLPAKLLDVPHLRNIADSPPYLHNGAANTLEEIWTRFNMTDRHGATADLTRQQFNDLIAYLKSL